MIIRYLPDRPLGVIGHIERPIRTLSKPARPVVHPARSGLLRTAREIVRKHFPFAAGLALLKRHKDHKIPGLRLRRPVPTAMESDKSAIFILVGELAAGIE